MTYDKYVLHFFILVCILISITSVSAVDLNDTVGHDVLNDVGEKSYGDLNIKINGENLNFTFESDYKFNGEIDKNYSGGVNITKDNFIIDGNNHRIDCGGQSRAFYITGKNVEINNLIIENAFYGYGSAIRTGSQLTLNNVTFINCLGDNETYSGGAIFSYRTTLNVNNCRFIDNGGKNGASLTSLRSTVNVVNSTFISGSDMIINGHIYLENSQLTVDSSNFLNTTSKYATAIFLMDDGNLNIKNSKFKNLFAYKTAGAIGAKVVSDLTVSNCEFDNVSSANNGGAIFVDMKGYDGALYKLEIENSVFNNCYSGFGGSILQLDGYLVINNTNFTSSIAHYEGGAVYTSDAYVGISNSKFKYNSLIDEMSYGGACYFDNGAVTLDGNSFENNMAFEGASVYAYDVTLNLIGNYFNNPSDAISIYTVYGKMDEERDNNYSSDVKSFNNTNNFYNFEGSASSFIIINNTLSFDEMPEKFDLRSYGWITPVKSQGFAGSCWAFGNLAALESSLLRYANKTYSLSVNNMQNSMLKYSKYGDSSMKEGGIAFSAVAYLIDWLGIFPEEYDGYDELGKISSLAITPEDIHIQNVVVIAPIKNASDRDLIKDSLIKYGAVSTAHYANFDKSKYFNESSSAQYFYGTHNANHRVCIVGWDDSYSRYNFLNTPEGDGAWICKNSWGTDWGDGGYFYVSYYDTSFATKESICYIVNNDSYTRIYQHDVGGEGKWMERSKYYANVFTADEDEFIGAVGTFFNQSGIEYEFTISVNDVDVHTQKGISKFRGYETIKLDKLVPIKKGEKFKVTFKNMLYAVNTLRIHPQMGQSFVSTDGESWQDLSNSLSVALLKAYAVSQMPAEIDITNETIDLKVGDTVQLNATLNPADAGNLTYSSINGSVVKVSDDGSIVAVGKGTAIVTVSFAGNDKYASDLKTVTINVGKVSTNLAAADVTATYNVNKYLVITLKDSKGKPLVGAGVTVDLNGAKTYTTDSNGQVQVSTNGLAPKTYTARITFDGNTNYEKSAKNVKVTVKKATPKLTAKKKTFKTTTKTKKYTITLKDNTGKAIKNAKVTLKVKGKTYKATTNSKGKAVFKIKNLKKKGTFKATITYKGNKYYNKVSKKANIKVIVTFKTVSKGSKDKSTVKEIQQALKDHGYYISYKGHYLKVDGKFKGCTERSVKEFQKDKGLKVTGKVDEKTAKKLGLI